MCKYAHAFFVFCLLAFALFFAGCNPPEKIESPGKTETGGTDKIKIGFLGAKTGARSYGGTECLKGIQMAVEDLNQAGGILNKKVELIEGDYASNSSEAVKVTQRLVDQQVVAIIGDNTTGITKLAATVCQSNKVVLVSPTATGSGVVELGDYIFRIALLDSVAVPAVVSYLTEEMQWKKAALVKTLGQSYTEGLTALFKPALVRNGIEIVSEQKIRKNDTNFSDQVTDLTGYQFDGLVFPGNFNEAAPFMLEMRKQGLQQVVVGGDSLFSRDLIKTGGSAVDGCLTYAGFAVDTRDVSPKTQEFIKKYQAKNDGLLPDVFSAQAYDAVFLVADAIKAAGSADPAIFREELAKTSGWEGVSGRITFDEEREPIKSPVYLMEVKKDQFVIKAVIPIDMF
jgi:branched-chain amino acid transport system substrate-binding protein